MRALTSVLRETYGGLPTATWLLSAAAFVNRSGTMVVPFLSIYLGARWGLTVSEAGMFIGLYGVGSIAGNLVGGRLCDRFGQVRVQVSALGGAGVWLWLLGFAAEPWALGAGLVVFGMLADAFRPANLSAVVASCEPVQRGKALALNRLAINLGWAIGPPLGGVLAMVDFAWLFAVDGATCALAALFLFRFRHRLPGGRERTAAAPGADANANTHADANAAAAGRSTAHRAAPPRGPSPFADGRFLAAIAGSFAVALAFLQYSTTEPRWLSDQGYAKRDVGLLLAVNPLLIVLAEMPLVHALRGRPQLPFVAAGALLIGAGFALLPLGASPGVVLGSLAVVTLGEMLWSPLLSAWIGDHAPEASRGRYLGLYGAVFALAWVVAPGIGGKIHDVLGPDALWLACLLAGALAAAGYALLHRAK